MHEKIHSYLLILFLLLPLAGAGQSSNLRLGDEEFKKLNYARAIVAYEAASDKNLRAYRNLAECYQVAGKLKSARYCLERVCDSDKRSAEDLWNFVQVLMRLEDYGAARHVLHAFYIKAPRDSRAKAYKNAGDFLQDLTKNSRNYALRYLPFNSNEQDFGAALYGKQLVFASTRRPYSPIVREWNGNQRSFLNLYSVNPYLKKARPKHFSKQVNGRFHEGPAAFSGDGKLCVVTRTHYREKDEKGIRNLGLYTYELKGKKWSNPIPFTFNDSTFSVGHATLNEDGTVMYFTSDMPGGKGGTDIWRTERNGRTWEKPEPLYSINTEGDEMFPYLMETSGVMLFASDGHVGLGGLDIFAAKQHDREFVKIRNLGAPVNSYSDDFGMLMDPKMKTGFFTSNRPAPDIVKKKLDKRDTLFLVNDDDIYWVKFKVPFSFGKTITGTVVDDNNQPVEGADLSLFYDGDTVKTATTTETGGYEFPVELEGEYTIQGNKEWYFDTEKSLILNKRVDDYLADFQMKRDPNISIRLVITDSEIGAPMEGVDLTIRNLLTGETMQHRTSDKGDFFLAMPQKRLNDSLSFQFTLKLEDHLTKTLTYAIRLNHFGGYDIHKARVKGRFLDFSMKKKTLNDDLALQLGILPYFYDSDKGVIAPDTTGELRVIARALRENPELKIEVVAHTDCRGAASTNLKLSQQRARAVAVYLQAKVPDGARRIMSRGAGESRSKSGCACDGPGGSNCTAEEYQIDRRTEFIIRGI